MSRCPVIGEQEPQGRNGSKIKIVLPLVVARVEQVGCSANDLVRELHLKIRVGLNVHCQRPLEPAVDLQRVVVGGYRLEAQPTRVVNRPEVERRQRKDRGRGRDEEGQGRTLRLPRRFARTAAVLVHGPRAQAELKGVARGRRAIPMQRLLNTIGRKGSGK